VLFVTVSARDSRRQLLMYYRANYHWFLKSVIELREGDMAISLSCEKHRRHKLLIVGQKDFQIV